MQGRTWAQPGLGSGQQCLPGPAAQRARRPGAPAAAAAAAASASASAAAAAAPAWARGGPTALRLAEAAARSGGECSTSGSGGAAAASGWAPRRARRSRPAPTAAAAKGNGSGAPTAPLQPPPPPVYLVEAGVDASGARVYEQLDAARWSEADAPAVATEELLAGLDGVDDGDEASDDALARAAASDGAEVPGTRLIVDPEELDLIGDGLPVIHGVSGFVGAWGGGAVAGEGMEVDGQRGLCRQDVCASVGRPPHKPTTKRQATNTRTTNTFFNRRSGPRPTGRRCRRSPARAARPPPSPRPRRTPSSPPPT